MFHQILFFTFAIVCVAGALNLLFQRHPINSALSLIVVMGSLSLLYLLLGAEFVAAVQIIVYAGAIMVLFVFVIMLLNAGEEERTRDSHVAYILGIPGVFTLLALMVYSLLRRMGSPNLQAANGTGIQLGGFYVKTQALGLLLFKEFLLPFEITSVLILVAIMGAVVLAKREH